MKNQKVMVIQLFLPKSCETFTVKFSQKIEEIDGALNLSLHVATLPVLVSMSWPSKTTQKLNL